MTSYRNQITDAIKAQLTGKTIAGAQVFTSLDRPLDPSKDLPAIMVYAQSSRRGKEDYGNSIIPRMVTVSIEAAVASSAGQELADVETLADEIEAAMEADRSLGLLVNDTEWQQTLTDVTSHGKTPMGVCLLQYSVEMLTNQRPDNAFEFNDDGFTSPPTSVQSVPNVVPPAGHQPEGNLCGPEGCNIPAWEGELFP